MLEWLTKFRLPGCAVALWGFLCPADAQPAPTGLTTNAITLTSVIVAGKPVACGRNNRINVGTHPENIVFNFEPNSDRGRLEFKLEGYEDTWHKGAPEMFLAVRFFNADGDQVDQVSFSVQGKSAGWNGSLTNSSLTHRRETLTVPAEALRMMLVISSAGPPATVGVYAVANLLATTAAGKTPPTTVLSFPFDQHPEEDNATPAGWLRDGNHASMAKVVGLGRDSATKALAILDDDAASHAEWHTTLQASPKVNPGDNVVVEWNELYNMGMAGLRQASYSHLEPGTYTFKVQAVDIFGMPTGDQARLNLVVPQPFWKRPWFWGVIFAGFAVIMFGAGRYVVWRKMRHEMLGLQHQQELERERLRIAHDIHDDLGARVTQISLLSAMSQDKPEFPAAARDDFGRISQMSRDLVAALYETVWTVNPENDNLDALGNYLCQMANQLCGGLQLRCRLHVQDLPREIEVSSLTRHHISLAVKEAVHNVIKHAHASEVGIHVKLEANVLTVSIQDNGRGFLASNASAGHGLVNLQQRLQAIGGSCAIESAPGKGTIVCLQCVVHSPANR